MSTQSAATTEAFAFPLSFAQQRLWFLDQLEPGNPIYNIPSALRLAGSLNITALEQSFNEIVRRHKVLRTTFAMMDEQPVQVIVPELRITLPVADLKELSEAEREAMVRRLMAEDRLSVQVEEEGTELQQMRD